MKDNTLTQQIMMMIRILRNKKKMTDCEGMCGGDDIMPGNKATEQPGVSGFHEFFSFKLNKQDGSLQVRIMLIEQCASYRRSDHQLS